MTTVEQLTTPSSHSTHSVSLGGKLEKKQKTNCSYIIKSKSLLTILRISVIDSFQAKLLITQGNNFLVYSVKKQLQFLWLPLVTTKEAGTGCLSNT